MRYKCPGEITVGLTLMLAVLFGFTTIVIESARAQAVRAQTERVMMISLHSCLGEYNQDLFQYYELLAVDCSYRSAAGDVENFTRHMKEYAEVNLQDVTAGGADWLKMNVTNEELQKYQLLNDEKGKVLYAQTAEVMTKYGMSGRNYDKLASALSAAEQSDFMEGFEEALEHVGEVSFNPAQEVYDTVTSEDFLTLMGISSPGENMPKSSPSTRTLKTGNYGKISSGTNPNQFYEYLIRYFGSHVKPKDHSVFMAEQEYLISGSKSEEKALRSVLKKILTQREEDNLKGLLDNGNAVKQAEEYAEQLCLDGDPEALKEALLYAWACGEAVVQVYALLQGGRVTMEGNTKFVIPITEIHEFMLFCGAGYGGGEDYQDYLCGLIATQSVNKLLLRSMDLLEINMKAMGHQGFAVDTCITGAGVRMDVGSEYGYTYYIEREKEYLK